MSDSEQPFQVMPDLDGDQFDRLKRDIEQHGVEYPIIVNGDGDVIDGHHRLEAWKALGRDPEDLPTRVVDEDESENYHRAYRANLLRRDLTDGTKRQVVKQYLLEHPERVEADGQKAIASDLGVSQKTVSNAVNDLRDSGKLSKLTRLSTEEKRQQVREYVDRHPDASNRTVADAMDFDVSHVTVGNWRSEWADDDTDDGSEATGLDTFTTSADEREATFELLSEAKAGDETAKKEVEEVDAGKKSPDEAKQDVEKAKVSEQKRAEAEQRREGLRQAFRESVDGDAITVRHGDFRDVLAEYDPGAVDHIITDPPYDEDALEQWDALGREAARVLPSDGFLVAYSGKAHLPAVYDRLTDHLDYYWQCIVHHSGAGAKIFSRTLRTNYKPVLVFTPPEGGLPDRDPFVSDVIDGAGREKDSHDWQQAEAEAAALVEAFTDPNDHVVDPMAGGGTTGIACRRVDRRCTLIDREQDAIDAIHRRVADES